MLRFHQIGNWREGEVRVAWAESTRRISPLVERLIDESWASATALPGVHLFDGPMCRLEAAAVVDGALRLSVSRTSYKPFLGTNLSHPELWVAHADCFANATGVSSALLTADGYLMFGRRNGSVAYYPHRVHPFAGALEPADPLDLFAEVRRELREELSLGESDYASIRCIGMAEDEAIHQPETIFAVELNRSRAEIERMVDATEHSASFAVRATAEEVARALANHEEHKLTPIAIASLLLWGRGALGEAWFDRSRGKFSQNFLN